MASGLPIITTDDPGYHAYAVDRNLIKFTSPDSVSLTKAISEVINDAPLAKNMKMYSLKLAKEWFDWRQNIHPVLELYSKLSMK
jgi:glycosyltransferase involved in cell wall biosynthesis